MMFRRRTEARKNGPIKALQPAISGGDNIKSPVSKTKSQEPAKSSRIHQQDKRSKDDIVMTHGQTKEKIMANPYATIKMWRPTSTDNSTISDASGDVYQSFTNFDALRNSDSSRDFEKGRQPPPTNDLRNTKRLELSYHGSLRENASTNHKSALGQGLIGSEANVTSHKATVHHDTPLSNGYEELPADYSVDSSADTLFTRLGLTDEMSTDFSLSKELTNGDSANASDQPPPPSSPTLHASPQMPSFTPSSSSSKFLRSTSISSSAKEEQDETSYQVVSDGTANSIKLVLSHSYTDMDLAKMDLERLLAELKLTMDLVRSSNGEKNSDQLPTCLSELHSHTKQFIHEAKLVVSSANNSHERMINQLESAVHTLAHVFLHGQATMLLMTSPDEALHLGFQIIKAVNSFKSTISAGSLALGKTLNDPNMKYLMRQAQNLAALLASLLNTIKEIETK